HARDRGADAVCLRAGIDRKEACGRGAVRASDLRDGEGVMGQVCSIWRSIVGSVILSSAARRNAFDRMTDSTLSPSKGSTRPSTGFDRSDWPRPGTMQRYWLLGCICILALPRWIRYVLSLPCTTRNRSSSVHCPAIANCGSSVARTAARVLPVSLKLPKA